jgi:hypothetical protein
MEDIKSTGHGSHAQHRKGGEDTDGGCHIGLRVGSWGLRCGNGPGLRRRPNPPPPIFLSVTGAALFGRQHHRRGHRPPRHLEAPHLANEGLVRNTHVPNEGSQHVRSPRPAAAHDDYFHPSTSKPDAPCGYPYCPKKGTRSPAPPPCCTLPPSQPITSNSRPHQTMLRSRPTLPVSEHPLSPPPPTTSPV